MKRAWTALVAASLLAVCVPATAQLPVATPKDGGKETPSKIAFVSTERILRDSAPALRAQRKLEAEFKKRDDELSRTADQLKRMQDEIEKNGLTLSEVERRNKEREFGDLNRDFQRKQREFREDINQRRNEELAQVVEQANRVIRQIAEQEKFDIIFQEMPAYVSPRIDITEKVIKALEGKPPAK
jgi:outer membrane protein